MLQYEYFRGSQNNPETIKITITEKGQHISMCVVNVQLLLMGFKIVPCNNGNYIELTRQQWIDILELIQMERKCITDSYSVKTYNGWQESGLPTFDDYCFPGDEVDEAMVEYFVNSVPPTTYYSTCTQDGEPFSHERDEHGNYRPTYGTFHRIEDGRWKFDGYCFEGENENKVFPKKKIQQLIECFNVSEIE